MTLAFFEVQNKQQFVQYKKLVQPWSIYAVHSRAESDCAEGSMHLQIWFDDWKLLNKRLIFCEES